MAKSNSNTPKKTISKKNQFDNNPRVITEKEEGLLKEHIEELGDLSGVVYCQNQKAFVGGNQRSNVFDGAKIDIVEKYDKPTKQYTVAHGFINYKGEKYAYREVQYSKELFDKACIVANNDGGSFDWGILSEWQEKYDLDDWGMVTEEIETLPVDTLSDDVDAPIETVAWFLNIEFEDEAEAQKWYNKLSKENLNIKIVQ